MTIIFSQSTDAALSGLSKALAADLQRKLEDHFRKEADVIIKELARQTLRSLSMGTSIFPDTVRREMQLHLRIDGVSELVSK